MKVGFIGLGLMGAPMAQNIFKAGFELTVYNRAESRTAEFKELGIKIAKTPADLAKNVNLIITMVTGPEDVREVLLGSSGVVKGAKKGLAVIDMSTIGPEAARQISKDLKALNIEFLDAPVTGSVAKALSGELTIFVGGQESVYKKALPILEAMGKDINLIGPVGSGQAIKLVNNLFVGVTLVALAEGFLLADTEGLAREKVVQFLQDVPAVSGFMKLKMPNMAKRSFKTAFSIANMSKDLSLALQEVKKGRKDVPLLSVTDRLYKQALEEGLGDLDNSAIIKILDHNS